MKLSTLGTLAFCLVFSFSACQKKADVDSAKPGIVELKRRASVEPSFQNWTQLGIAQLQAHLLGDAVDSFQKSVQINPNAPIAYNNLCAAYNELKQWKQGEENCRHAVQLEPSLQIAKNNLALAQSQIQAARDRIRKLGNPQTGADFIKLGLEFYSLGENQEAITAWARVKKSDPLRAVAQNDIASASILMKNWSAARKAINEARSIQPSNQLFMNNEAWLISAQKTAEEKK